MRMIFLTITMLLSFKATAIPHLDLEMSSDEYRTLLQKASQNKSLSAEDPAIEASLKLGDRLSKWISIINSSRPVDAAIRLTSAQTRRGIPIESPSIYSPSIIKSAAEKILAELPEEMKTVITTNGEFPTSIGIDDETFIKHARLIDRNYQSAARYKSVNAYRSQYISAASEDVRGYYYLTKNNITAEQLKDSSSIARDQVPAIKDALTKICLNAHTDSLAGCRKKIETSFMNNTLASTYNNFFPAAKSNWNNFFVIPSYAKRSDVNWFSNTLTVPFNTPSIAKFIPYLQDNIEDEFRFKDWKLRINFGSYVLGPRLVFQPGVVPHVNGLGGNQIVMDSNQPIEEYESQWTIRHEFGHVLGLPDCYHEFYDTTLDAFVNYQLDTTDLMCSRAGNMKERIYQELKRSYIKVNQ